jgi:hypothetical protein
MGTSVVDKQGAPVAGSIFAPFFIVSYRLTYAHKHAFLKAQVTFEPSVV